MFAPAPFVERVAPAPVRVAPTPVVERVAAPAPVFAPNFVGPAFGPAPVFGAAPFRGPVTTGAWPAPKTSVQQAPAAQNPGNQKPSTATAPKNAQTTAPKNAQTAAPKAPAKNAQTIKPIGSTTEKLAASRK